MLAGREVYLRKLLPWSGLQSKLKKNEDLPKATLYISKRQTPLLKEEKVVLEWNVQQLLSLVTHTSRQGHLRREQTLLNDV